MSFQYLTNVPLAQAQEEYSAALAAAGFAARTEVIPVTKANGRITAEAVYARICAPHYPASAMDGIAIAAKSSFSATETTPIDLAPADFTVVDTGDPIPDGCDAVIMVEDLTPLEDGSMRIFSPAAPWQHIRQIGEDICAGEMILPAHTKISPASIGAMLAAGVMELRVLARPMVGIIPTGDEVVPPTADPKPGDIIEFNSSIFSGMLADWGAESLVFPIVPDRFDAIKATVSEALQTCDMVILNAGSSAGRDDNSASVLSEVGTVLCHGLAIKPGKPAILALQGKKPLLGVPGYPVSGILVLEQILKPLIRKWFCDAENTDVYRDACLSRSVVSGLKYQEFVRVRLGKVGDKLMASPLNRGAGVVSSFMKADGILEVPQGTEGYEAGANVKIRLLKNPDALAHTIVAIGSHDPLLDEVANLLHLDDPAISMSSSHVGSMGGIMAIKRGETHVAGCHLLDEKDGSYNRAYIRKHFPGGGVYQVECVGRTQGLMIAKGNPKNIRGIADLARSGMRYVNRQRGSGTRILMDYLCKKEGIDTGRIYGYQREEFTHTSVAAQIASGTADAGMGIYSAAQLYDLDFLPICTEQYDLLIPDYAWETDEVQKLIGVLKSEAFRSRLEEMGGYTLDKPGEVREHF